MPGDLPLYKSGLKRSRQNKRFIIAFALLGVGFIFYLNLRLTVTSSETDHDRLSSHNDYHPPKQSLNDEHNTNPPELTLIDIDVHTTTDDNSVSPYLQPTAPSDSHEPMTPLPAQEFINTARHYSLLVIVTSDTSASSIERRRLIRESYFGLRDNLLPCMVYNTNVYYKFLIHGDPPPSDTPLRRRYEAEKMEWNDMVEMEKSTSPLEQVHVLQWVETSLSAQGVTYDYLILQDINTFIQLDVIKQELDSGVIGNHTHSPFTINTDAPTSFVWGNFRADATDMDIVVAGSTAVKRALQLVWEMETTIYNKQEPILTKMYNYYQVNMDLLGEDGHGQQQHFLEFIREDGPEGMQRFIHWENNVESVHSEDIAVTRIYQNQDFNELVYWTRLNPVSVCYHHRGNAGAMNQPDDTGDRDDYDEVMEALVEEHHPVTEQQQRLEDGLAVVTSSFIYDACMEPSATRAAMNKRNYALKHGYAFVARSAEFAQEAARRQRKTVWGKIDVVEKVLPKYDWVFWLDMDAVVMDQERTLEDILYQVKQLYPQGAKVFDEQVDFVVSRPFRDPMINAGVFLIKNTPWSMAFLREIQKTTTWYHRGPSYEQGAMWDVMRRSENQDKVFLLDRDDHTFNTFPSFYKPGDFVVHFAPDKCPNDATTKGLDAADKILGGGLVTKLDFD